MASFIGPKDTQFFQNKNSEYYKLFFISVEVWKMSPQQINSTYGEDANKNFTLAYSIEAYIPSLEEYKNDATKFGLDENRTLRIFFGQDLLNKSGLEFPKIGDHVVIQGLHHKIVQTNPVDFEGNSQIPLSHVCDLIRIKFENPEQSSTVWRNF